MIGPACTRCAMLSALVLILCGSAAFAAEPRQADPPDIPTHTAEPVQAEPVESEPKLLGDLGRRRPALATYGLDLGLSYIGETFGVVHGGVKRGAIYEGQAGVGLGIDLEKLIGWPGAKAYANALQIRGPGAS